MGEELQRHGHGYGHGHRRASSPPAVVVACWDVATGGAFTARRRLFLFIPKDASLDKGNAPSLKDGIVLFPKDASMKEGKLWEQILISSVSPLCRGFPPPRR